MQFSPAIVNPDPMKWKKNERAYASLLVRVVVIFSRQEIKAGAAGMKIVPKQRWIFEINQNIDVRQSKFQSISLCFIHLRLSSLAGEEKKWF
jgi:hypothetical protein